MLGGQSSQNVGDVTEEPNPNPNPNLISILTLTVTLTLTLRTIAFKQ